MNGIRMTRRNRHSTSTNGIFGNTRSEASHLPRRRAAPPDIRPPVSTSDVRALSSAIEERTHVSGLSPRTPSGVRGWLSGCARSELVEVDAEFYPLAPDLDLGVATDVVRHLVPAGLDAPGGLFRRDVLVHDVGKIVIE